MPMFFHPNYKPMTKEERDKAYQNYIKGIKVENYWTAIAIAILAAFYLLIFVYALIA